MASTSAAHEVVGEADLKVMQGEALRLKLANWLQDLRSKGTVPAPEDSRRLAKQFTKECLGDMFEILPQDLREEDNLLRARVSYLLDGLLKGDAEEKEMEVDKSQPPHEQVWEAMWTKASALCTARTKERRYESFCARHKSSDILALLEKCADKTIWEECVVGGRAVDPAFLHSMTNDWRVKRPGWYLIFMWDQERQVWEWYRVYVGQAGGGNGGTMLMQRGRQHFTNSKDLGHTELLYRCWRAFLDEVDENKMRKAKILRLGFADQEPFSESGDFDLFLNLGEMFFSLIFRGLQLWDLRKWLPQDMVSSASDLAPVGLNVALPVNQSLALESCQAFGKLVHSEDPDVVAHVKRVLRSNLQKVYDNNFASIVDTLRAQGSWNTNNITRDGPAGQTVRVKCAYKKKGSTQECGWQRDDEKPRFVVRTGEYVNRTQACEMCELSVTDQKMKCANARKKFRAVDTQIPQLDLETLSKRTCSHKNKGLWREYYTGVRPYPPV